MTLDEARAGIGRRVNYPARPDAESEAGVILSVNAFFVFVSYVRNRKWTGGTATRAEDLEFE